MSEPHILMCLFVGLIHVISTSIQLKQENFSIKILDDRVYQFCFRKIHI